MNLSDSIRLHAVVEGRVQGVGFRNFVIAQAGRLDLTGWVRNTSEGHVEVTAEGPRADLEKLLAALYQGPRSAYVIEISYDWLPATGEFAGFAVTRTV